MELRDEIAALKQRADGEAAYSTACIDDILALVDKHEAQSKPNDERPARADLLYLSGKNWCTEMAEAEVQAKGFAAVVEATDANAEVMREWVSLLREQSRVAAEGIREAKK